MNDNFERLDLIRRLSEIRSHYNCFNEKERKVYHTLSEAIEALSDVPDTNVGDMISRQDAIDAIDCDIVITGRKNAELVAETIAVFADRIKSLPSAEKTGKWIHAYDCDCFQCNQCGTPSIVAQPYCCICGAKMGVQDD